MMRHGSSVQLSLVQGQGGHRERVREHYFGHREGESGFGCLNDSTLAPDIVNE
jgi:hypothetical protein